MNRSEMRSLASAALILAAFAVTGCGTLRRIPETSSMDAVVSAASGSAQVIDLTQPLGDQATFYPSLFPALGTGSIPMVGKFMPVHLGIRIFPGGSPFYYTAPDNGHSGHITCGEHTGTHTDAPNHFVPMGADMADAQVTDLLRQAVIIDIRKQAVENVIMGVTAEHLIEWEKSNGRIPAGSMVFLMTGHEKKAGDLNTDHPGFTEDAAVFLREERDIAGVGTDSLSPDIAGVLTFPVHKRLLADECLIIENVRHLDRLPVQGAHVLIGVLPLNDGSGSPSRVMAIINDQRMGSFEAVELTYELDKQMPFLHGRDPLYSDLDIPVFDDISFFDAKLTMLPKGVPIDRETTAKPLYHGYYNGYFSMGVSTGTHVVFPRRNIEIGVDAAAYPIEKLFAKAVVVNLEDVPDNETLSKDGLLSRIGDADLHGAVLILYTGRDRKGLRKNRLHPGIDADGAAAAMEMGALGIATDAVSIDSLDQEGRPAEQAVHARGGYVAGSLMEPNTMPRTGGFVAFLPLPIAGSGAAPARVIGYRPAQ